MKLLLPLRIRRDVIDLVNLWSSGMGFRSAGFVRSVSSLGTKRSGSRAHGVLQVAGESIRLSRCLESFSPPPFIS